MPDHSKDLSGDSEKVVYLEAKPDTLAKLFNFLRDRTDYEWWELDPIAKLGARYQFYHLPILVLSSAMSLLQSGRSHGSSFAIFAFAAERELLHFAAHAILYFDYTSQLEDIRTAKDVGATDFKGIPGHYTAALLSAMSESNADSPQYWADVSASFSLKL
jgi:hypothetical protein